MGNSVEYDVMRVFHVSCGGIWMEVGANSAVEALACALCSPESCEYWDEEAWECEFKVKSWPETSPLTITMEDGDQTKTCAEWVDGWTEAKILCASEWAI